MNCSEMQQFCWRLPKVELHTHLNTSYSLKSLGELITLCGDTFEHALEDLHITSDRDIDESFKLYSRIQKLVRTEEAVYLLTNRVISEYAADNVKYLELRSTPKDIPETGMTRELYVRTMIRAVQDCQQEGLDIIVKILVSIDRRQGVKVAEIAVDLAEKLMKETDGLVVGIDFSGDPKVGDALDYIPVFLDAGRRGLKLGLHLAELPNFEETKQVLQACCDNCVLRIGHGTYLHRYDQGMGYDEIQDLVLEKKIPIEVCLTSNLRTKTVENLKLHHFKYWQDKNHPVILCTDGKGAYNTSLSQEYTKAASTFNLSKQSLKEYVISTIDHIFASESTKNTLREQFQQFEL
uniref:Adenosine deaminase domain-containing protein n=2 Tax=Arion vulgaris TaxID=1028688 RepID=A0A0B7APX1_9EUPU